MSADVGSSSRDFYDGDWDESDYSEDEAFFVEEPSLANSNKSKKPYTTPVLLGYADEPADDVDYQKAYDEYTEGLPTVWDSRLGGKPIWLHANSKPEKNMITCESCKNLMTFLAQLSMPKRDSFYERVLYVFVCRNPGCRQKEGSIKCVKGFKRDAAKEKEAEQKKLEETAAKENELAEKQKMEQEKKQEEKKKQEKLAQSLFSSNNDDSSANENPFNTGPFGSSTKNETKSESSNPFGSANPFGQNPFSASAKKEEKEVSKKPAAEKKPAVETYASRVAKSSESSNNKTSSKPVPAKTTSSVSSVKPEYSNDDIPVFTSSFFIDTEYETIDPKAMEKSQKDKNLPSSMTPEDIKKLMLAEDDLDDEVEVKGKGKGKNSRTISERLEDASAFEEVMGKEDPTFQHFVDIVSQNSDQILRYYRLLEESPVSPADHPPVKPLLYSSKDTTGKKIMSGIPKPKSASAANTTNYMELSNLPIGIDGKPRSIEFQIMPYAISVLERDLGLKEMLEKGMEWGTIFVATSEGDYLPKLDENGIGYSEEWVGVQWETQK